MVSLEYSIIRPFAQNIRFSRCFSDNPWRAQFYQVWFVEKVINGLIIRGSFVDVRDVTAARRRRYSTWLGVGNWQGFIIFSLTQGCGRTGVCLMRSIKVIIALNAYLILLDFKVKSTIFLSSIYTILGIIICRVM